MIKTGLVLFVALVLCGCVQYTRTVTHYVNDTGEQQIVTEWREEYMWGVHPKGWSPDTAYIPRPRPKRTFPEA